MNYDVDSVSIARMVENNINVGCKMFLDKFFFIFMHTPV